MMRLSRSIPSVAAAGIAAVFVSALAADASTERTTMPEFCSSREVTCVLPDGPPRVRAASPLGNSGAGAASGGPQAVIIPPQTSGSTSLGTTSSSAGGTTGMHTRGANPAGESGTSTSRHTTSRAAGGVPAR